MKPVDSIEFQNFVSYFQDDDICYLLSRWKDDAILTALNPSSLKTNLMTTLKFNINTLVNPVIDDNYIYFFTQMNGVFVIDKFSLDQHDFWEVDSAVPISNVEQDEDCLYVICGTPMMTGVKTNTDLFSVITFDKKTGKRKGQSQMFHKGNFSQIALNDGFLWCVMDKKLLKLDKSGELIGSVDLQLSTRHNPIVSENLVTVLSRDGLVESFDKKTLKAYKKKVFNRNDFTPFLYQNSIIWGQLIVHLDDFSSSTLNYSVRYIKSDNQSAYATDTLNNVLLISQGINDAIEVDKDLSKPMVFNDYLLVYSSNSSRIFRISK